MTADPNRGIMQIAWPARWAVLGLLLLPGCGGSKPSSGGAQPGPGFVIGGKKTGEPAPAVAAANPGAGSPKEAPRVRKKKKSNRESNAEAVELADGEALYAASEPVAGRSYAIQGAEGSEAADRFSAPPIPAGADSSHYAIAGPPIIPQGDAGDSALAATDAAGDAGHYELPKEGFEAVRGAGVGADGLPLRLRCVKDGSEMALVPAGVFIQGKESGPENARPEHGVFLDAYYIDVTEVTSDQYEKFRDAQRADRKRVSAPTRTASHPQEPVLGINAADAQHYAEWAGKGLPTEAQWEKAARGPSGFDFPWGNEPPLWERPRAPGQIDRVGSFQGDRSPFGVLDMAGNAREWCSDWYSESAYQQALDAGDSTPRNPVGPRNSGNSKQRVVKGSDPVWKVWARMGIVLFEKPPEVGFRCVLSLKLVAPETSGAKSKGPSTKAKSAR